MPFIYLQLVPRDAPHSSDYSFSVYYPTISMLLHIMRHVRSVAKLSKPFSNYYFTTSLNVTSCLIPIQTCGVHWFWLLRVDLIYECNFCLSICFSFQCPLSLIVLNRQRLASQKFWAHTQKNPQKSLRYFVVWTFVPTKTFWPPEETQVP